MRGLDEIIARNARAAGREAGHADTDWKDEERSAIIAAEPDPEDLEFITGYLSGRKDG